MKGSEITKAKNGKRWVVTILILVFCFIAVHMVQAVVAQQAEPGSEGDPLVTQGYVDKVVDDLDKVVAGLTTKIATLTKSKDDLAKKVNVLTEKASALEEKTSVPKFAAVKLAAGKRLVAGDSAEVILRSGKAVGIKGTSGGLADVTDGKDIGSGAGIQPNHLLICARNDGRGIKAVDTVWLLVKGSYTIK